MLPDAAWPRRLRCNMYGINLEAALGAHERLGSRPDGGDAGESRVMHFKVPAAWQSELI